jgi:Na+-driven multidrug efflux pump
MFTKAKISLKQIDYKLLISLIILGLCPTIYTTVRIFFLGQLPSEWSYSIAGQLSWVNLIYEIFSEAIILPLFYFIGKSVNNKNELNNRVKTGMLITFVVFGILSIIIIAFANPLLKLMATDESLIAASAFYIRIESVASIFSMLANFALVVLVTLDKSRYVYIITFAKVVLCVIFDTFFVSTLSFSLNLGVNGIGYSNIIVNLLLLITSLILLSKEGVKVFNKQKMSFSWTKELFKVGGISGLESLVRNIAYMLMIVRMVNVVNEQGTYWVANNFIWGWLLLPISQLAELIKRDCATDKNAIQNKSIGYFIITAVICIIWCISIPTWKPFMTYVLQYSDVEKLYSLVLVLLGFYVLYAFQNVFDSTFYGIGKTNYMLFESIVTNCIYYGVAFILYATGIWVPTLTGIALLFGIGMAFDSLVSLGVYIFLLKKQKINILHVHIDTYTPEIISQ